MLYGQLGSIFQGAKIVSAAQTLIINILNQNMIKKTWNWNRF